MKTLWFVAMLVGFAFSAFSAVHFLRAQEHLVEATRLSDEARKIREDAVHFASMRPQPPYTAAPVEGETCRCRVWECRREP
jgi:hypothetical protein